MNPVELLTGSSDDLVAANRRDLEIARGEVARLKTMTAPRSAAEALGAYDRAVAALADASARASVARNAHPSAAMRDAAEVCEQEVDALSTEMSLDRGIYEPVRDLDVSGEDAGTRFYVWRVLRDFCRAGVDRDDETRARIRVLNDELVRIGQEFSRNIRDDIRGIDVDPGELASAAPVIVGIVLMGTGLIHPAILAYHLLCAVAVYRHRARIRTGRGVT